MPPPTLSTPNLFWNPRGRKPPSKRSTTKPDFTPQNDTPISNTAPSSSNDHASPQPTPTITTSTTTTTTTTPKPQSMFPSFLDNSPSSIPSNSTSTSNSNSNANANANANAPLPNSLPRLAPSPMSQQQPGPGNQPLNGAVNGVNGAGGMGGLPMNAGQQMDVNLLWQKVAELSETLRENRERTRGVVEGAGELAARATANGAPPSPNSSDSETLTLRIAHLEHALATTRSALHTTTRENSENTRLLGDYETAIGSIVEMVRNYAFSQKSLHSSLSKQYNKLLQEEKDAHLEARLEKDEWFARYGRVVEMLREGYKRRCEEDEGVVGVVRGLQEEVRAYRGVLGMEREERWEEGGWGVLRDAGGEEGEGEE